MRFFLSSCAALLGSVVLSSAFPTAANVAILARSGGLDVPDDLSLEDVLRHVQRHKEKRLLINPLDKPIEGMPYKLNDGDMLTHHKLMASTNGKLQILMPVHKEVLVPVSMH